MNLHQGLIIFLCFLLGICSPLLAMAATETPDQIPPLVEVHIPQDNLAPYKDRRLGHGYYVALGYEGLLLNKFVSGIQPDFASYNESYGENPIPIIKLNLDYKYNIALGSLALGVEVGTGKITGSFNGDSRSLEVLKYGIAAKFVADMIWNEPYVVPYLGGTVGQMDLTEKTGTDTLSESSPTIYNYTVGLMIQLDWIDYATAKEATFNLGLENTFIDLYITQYMGGDETKANTDTDILYGANLRFEF